MIFMIGTLALFGALAIFGRANGLVIKNRTLAGSIQGLFNSLIL
jgi:hypothetical protein